MPAGDAMSQAKVLEKELRFFEAHKKEWLQHYKGHFALIKDEQLLGTFTSFQEAFDAGVEKVGNVPFLVKQILEKDTEVQFPALTVGVLHADL